MTGQDGREEKKHKEEGKNSEKKRREETEEDLTIVVGAFALDWGGVAVRKKGT